MKIKPFLIVFAVGVIILAVTETFFSYDVFCLGIKNPFISPFKVEQYKNVKQNPLSGINLEGLIVSSNARNNIAIINGKPYYKGSKIMGKTISGITGNAVYIKLKNGRIIKLSLAKVEGFK